MRKKKKEKKSEKKKVKNYEKKTNRTKPKKKLGRKLNKIFERFLLVWRASQGVYGAYINPSNESFPCLVLCRVILALISKTLAIFLS